MNKVLKWVLIILLGLVILAVIAGIVVAIFGGFRYGIVHPGFRMMEPFRFGYSPFRMIFGGLLGLGIFLLVIVGIVALVNALMHSGRSAQMTSSSPMTAPTQMETPSRTCSNCGKPAQDDWKTCPYCGNPLT